MKLLEYEGKALFEEFGLNVTKGIVASSVEEAKNAAKEIGYPVVIKAQVLTGGRGKAGGIKIVSMEEELVEQAEQILGMVINGEVTESVLITEKTEIVKEFYAGITLDPSKGLPVLIFSPEGGVEIERVAKENPEKVFKLYLSPISPLRKYTIIDFLRKTSIDPNLLTSLAGEITKLIGLFYKVDATTAEINPLVITSNNELISLDSKIVIDDSALGRHPSFELKEEVLTDLEERAKKINVNYVPLDEGNIAVIAGGAGLAMATMDLVYHLKGIPASFLDTGGGISSTRMAESLRISLANSNVNGVIINVFGGINNCEIMAKGIAEVVDNDQPTAKIVVKMRGHSQDEGWKILEDRNIPIIKYGTSEEAVQLLINLAEGRA